MAKSKTPDVRGALKRIFDDLMGQDDPYASARADCTAVNQVLDDLVGQNGEYDFPDDCIIAPKASVGRAGGCAGNSRYRTNFMTMTQSNSSQVAAFGYDSSTETLRVQFRSGGTYEYGGVSAEKFAEMQAADSHGKFLAARVKPYHTATKLPEQGSPMAPIVGVPADNPVELKGESQ